MLSITAGHAPTSAERQAGQRAHLLLELAGGARVDLKWPVLCGRGAISLTSSRSVGYHEHLDAQHADVVERRRDARARRPRLGRDRGVTRAGSDR